MAVIPYILHRRSEKEAIKRKCLAPSQEVFSTTHPVGDGKEIQSSTRATKVGKARTKPYRYRSGSCLDNQRDCCILETRVFRILEGSVQATIASILEDVRSRYQNKGCGGVKVHYFLTEEGSEPKYVLTVWVTHNNLGTDLNAPQRDTGERGLVYYRRGENKLWKAKGEIRGLKRCYVRLARFLVKVSDGSVHLKFKKRIRNILHDQ